MVLVNHIPVLPFKFSTRLYAIRYERFDTSYTMIGPEGNPVEREIRRESHLMFLKHFTLFGSCDASYCALTEDLTSHLRSVNWLKVTDENTFTLLYRAEIADTLL